MAKGSEDYIQSFGNVVMINTYLKFSIIVLGLVCVLLGVVVVSMLGKVQDIKPLPIYIDKTTGSAKPVDFKAVDASGETRIDVEIIDFCNTYISNLYTFNQYTIKSNLNQVFAISVKEVSEKLKYYLTQDDRAKWINSGVQGMCDVFYTDIVTTKEDIKVQVSFRKKILKGDEEILGLNMVAIMRLRPVVRSLPNSHGLLVVEYRESKLKELGDEK